MSIINDALKKTQLSFKKKEKPEEKKPEVKQEDQSTSNVYEKLYNKHVDQQNPSAPGQGQKPTEKKAPALRSAKKWLKTSGVAVVCLLLLSAGFYFVGKIEPVQDFYQSLKKRTRSAQTSIARNVPKRRSYKPGELVLNGTSLIDGKRVALINDEIYEVGETVDGKKITNINLNQIEIRDNEKIITLRVH